MKQHSRYKTARGFLIFWCLFIGVGAVGGAIAMLTAPDGSNLGMGELLPYFQVLPFSKYLFQDFIFSGISLLIVNGLTNLTAAYFLFRKKKAGNVLGTLFGVTLMLWICIQFVIFPMNFMSTIYFVFGALQAITGIMTCVFYEQERFQAQKFDYKNIGTNKKELVVFFSRMGYVKKAAYDEAEKTGAEVYEVKSTEHTAGTKGFWWCGRFGMHKWEMPIESITAELEAYDKVTVCTPVWVFNLAPPMKSFCKQVGGRIKAADYILVHHQKSAYKNVADEIDALLKIKRSKAKSVCCRCGKVKKTIEL